MEYESTYGKHPPARRADGTSLPVNVRAIPPAQHHLAAFGRFSFPRIGA